MKRDKEKETGGRAVARSKLGKKIISTGRSSGQETARGATGGSEKGDQGSSGSFQVYFCRRW